MKKFNLKNRAIGFLLLIALMFSENAYAITDALKIRIAKGTYSDETIIRFLSGATTGFDGSYDAWKLFSSNVLVPNIFTKITAGDLTINAFPGFNASITTDVFLKISTADTYTITVTEIGAFGSGVKIIMKDLVTDQLYDLKGGKTFIISLPLIDQTASARFQVFFSYPAATQIVDATCTTCSDGALAVTKAGESSWQYSVINEAGSNVRSGTASSSVQNISSLASGNYTVSISGNFSYTENKSFVVNVTPVTLGATFMDFTAALEAGIVNLFWSTGMESNTDYFTVERSEDGTDYEPIGQVAAAGNSSVLRTYTSSDEHPSKRNVYYRIKLTDLNGDISYGKVVTVLSSDMALVSFFPNPACEILNVRVEGEKDSELLLVIRDIFGKEVFTRRANIASENESIVIDIPAMIVPGVYFVGATGGKGKIEQKIIIK